MFLENKYSRCYFSIISQAQQDVNSRFEGRYEKHHIIPKSMGGSDLPGNLVKLTPREHFVCHLLLTKMTAGKDLYRMTAALNLMVRNTNKRLDRAFVTNRTYDMSRFYARVEFSEEHRRKLSEAAKRRDPSTRVQTPEANAKRSEFMKGYKKTPEHIANQAASVRGKKRGSWGAHSDQTKAILSEQKKGIPKSDEARKKMSEAKLGKKRGPMSEEHRAKIGEAVRLQALVRGADKTP